MVVRDWKMLSGKDFFVRALYPGVNVRFSRTSAPSPFRLFDVESISAATRLRFAAMAAVTPLRRGDAEILTTFGTTSRRQRRAVNQLLALTATTRVDEPSTLNYAGVYSETRWRHQSQTNVQLTLWHPPDLCDVYPQLVSSAYTHTRRVSWFKPYASFPKTKITAQYYMYTSPSLCCYFWLTNGLYTHKKAKNEQ